MSYIKTTSIDISKSIQQIIISFNFYKHQLSETFRDFVNHF